MLKYSIHGRMDKDSDWHFLGVFSEEELSEKVDYYLIFWRYLKHQAFIGYH